MSVDKYRPHVLILPEDDDCRQIANGFLLNKTFQLARNARSIQALPNAGGWRKAVGQILEVHITAMLKYNLRHVVLIIDFDRDEQRMALIKDAVPTALADRVFVVGSWSEAKDLKGDFGGLEAIGARIAEDCENLAMKTWDHPLLSHNAGEARRMTSILRPFLFASETD